MAGTVQEFLIEIQASQHVDCSALAAILVGRARAGDETTRLVAMRWLREFVVQAKEQLLSQYASILAAVLPGLSHSNSEVAAVRSPAAAASRLPVLRTPLSAAAHSAQQIAAGTCGWGCHRQRMLRLPRSFIVYGWSPSLSGLLSREAHVPRMAGTGHTLSAVGMHRCAGGQGYQPAAAGAAQQLAVQRHRGCPGGGQR